MISKHKCTVPWVAITRTKFLTPKPNKKIIKNNYTISHNSLNTIYCWC